MLRPKPIRGYDGKLCEKPISHAIYPNLLVQNHFERLAPLLITPLGQHSMILGKTWLNTHGVLIDMLDDKLIFDPKRCQHGGATEDQNKLQSGPHEQLFMTNKCPFSSPPEKSPSTLRVTKRLKRPEGRAHEQLSMTDNCPMSKQSEDRPHEQLSMTDNCPLAPLPKPNEPKATKPKKKRTQKRRRSAAQAETTLTTKGPETTVSEPPISVAMIGAAAFRGLAKKKGVNTFSVTPHQIDVMLKSLEDSPLDLNPIEVAHAQTSHEDIRAKLPPEYHDFLDVFDRVKAEALAPHRSYDMKIELEKDAQPPKSKLYPMSGYKLQKVKEYLTENLKKGYITPSNAPYASPILFAEKKDGSLRFCVDYRKLNAITKRDRYPIPLIDEVLARVVGSKYLTRLAKI